MENVCKTGRVLPAAAAVIAAAGRSARMGFDKLMAELGGIPVLMRTIEAFERCEAVSEIVIVTREANLSLVRSMVREGGYRKVREVVRGGETRQQSVYAGVMAVSPQASLLCIHDGARPLVSSRVITAAIQAAAGCGAATASLPVKDTIKRCRDGFSAGTVPREELMRIQTPQVFERSLYLRAYEAAREEYTDDCQLIEAIGAPVAFSRGDEWNIKLTTEEDLLLAEAMLQGEAQ